MEKRFRRRKKEGQKKKKDGENKFSFTPVVIMDDSIQLTTYLGT